MKPMKAIQPTETTTGRPFTSTGKGAHKIPVVSLVQRGGKVRSFKVDRADKASVARIVMENVHGASRLHTDESRLYAGADAHCVTHETVNHSALEYARGDVTTNSVEGFFSIFKRGMKGVYQHCQEKHLHRYLSEYDFRYNNRVALGVDDEARAVIALNGVVGKRLTYKTVGAARG
jgi:hypothetical protein